MIAVILLDETRKICAANDAAGELLSKSDCIEQDKVGRLTARSKGSAAALDELLSGGRAAFEGQTRLFGWSTDLGDRTNGILRVRYRLLMLVPRRDLPAPDLGPIRMAFGLSAAESKLLSALIEGRSLTEFARREALSAHTVRNQLKSVFSKVGARRQVELVARVIAALGPFALTSVTEIPSQNRT